MKIKVKYKVVIKVLLIYWSCFFILWFFFKKLPEIRENNAMKVSIIQNFVTHDKPMDFLPNILV